jgi:enoyl-CoA hydratase/carnithine racemase
MVRQPDVIQQKTLGLRSFILNRPSQLNALNLSMVRKITPQLQVPLLLRNLTHVPSGGSG